MSGTTTETSLRYLPALDGLRALAVVGVLVFHAGYLRGGFLGVDLFFVLSGFLITWLLLAEAATPGGVRLGRFWARRAQRLMPAVALVLVAVGAYAAWLAAPTEGPRLRADAVATLAYVANWHALLASQDYWSLFGAPSPLQHTWSLAIEEQFYLVWPLLVAALARTRRPARTVGAVALGLGALSATWMALCVTGSDPSRAYYGTDTRAAALLLGAALAARVVERGHPSGSRERLTIEVGAVLAVVVLAVAWATADGHGVLLYRGGFVACELAVVCLLLAASHPSPGRIARALSWAPLRYLGQISYGLYLWHWPAFVALSEPRTGLGGVRLLALRLAASVALAVVSYHAVERPLRRVEMRGGRLALLATSSLLALGVAVVGTLEGERRATTRRAVEEVTPRPWTQADALARAHAAPLRMLVAGDSVARALVLSAQPATADLAVTLCDGGTDGCGLFEGVHRYRRPDGKEVRRGQECPPLASWGQLARACEADAAVVMIAPPVLGAWEIDGRWSQACEPGFDALFERQALRAVDALAGRSTLVATLPYGLGDGWDASARHRTDCLNLALRRAVAARPPARVFDLAPRVCPGGQCPVRVDGVVLRPDGLHFDHAGAQLVAWWLVDAVRRP